MAMGFWILPRPREAEGEATRANAERGTVARENGDPDGAGRRAKAYRQ
jgi:hypothetical protein